jgi:hypothetical protein
MNSPSTVLVVSASIGAGHDGYAAEIARRLRIAGSPVRRVDYLDLLPAGWGQTIKQAYARQLAYAPATWGWLLDAAARPLAEHGITGGASMFRRAGRAAPANW